MMPRHPPSTVRTVRTLTSVILMAGLIASGTDTVHIALGGITQDVALTVHPPPAVTTAMSVDSFIVEEDPLFADGCSCYYLPIPRLRAASGGSSFDAIRIELSLPSLTTGLCQGSMWFGPGQADNLIVCPVDSDHPSRPFLVLNSPNGLVPDGPAVARVIVRDVRGYLGLVLATSVIQRGVPLPVLSTAEPCTPYEWSCS